MKRILLAALTGLLSLSATAIADPDNRSWDRERSHYDRFDRWGGQREYTSRWLTLGSEYTATSERQFITAHDQIFDRIRLEATRGAPYIYQVAILYTNGASQVVKLNQRLAPGGG